MLLSRPVMSQGDKARVHSTSKHLMALVVFNAQPLELTKAASMQARGAHQWA